jgi:hypothetical protein
MKLQIEIESIKCKRTTREWSKDEVYFLLLVASAKKNGNYVVPIGQPVYGKVSEVKKEFDSDSLPWRPSLNNIEIDIENAEAMAVTFALYEKDNGSLYEQLQKKANGVISADEYEFPKIKIPKNKPEEKSDWIEIILAALNVVISLVKHWKKDDLIGQKEIPLEKSNVDEFSRPFELIGNRGKYQINLKFKLYDDKYQLQGIVFDSDDQPLKGVTVSVVNSDISTSTDTSGKYFISGLEPGSIDIESKLDGFESQKIEGIVIKKSKTFFQNFKLTEKENQE